MEKEDLYNWNEWGQRWNYFYATKSIFRQMVTTNVGHGGKEGRKARQKAKTTWPFLLNYEDIFITLPPLPFLKWKSSKLFLFLYWRNFPIILKELKFRTRLYEKTCSGLAVADNQPMNVLLTLTIAIIRSLTPVQVLLSQKQSALKFWCKHIEKFWLYHQLELGKLFIMLMNIIKIKRSNTKISIF